MATMKTEPCFAWCHRTSSRLLVFVVLVVVVFGQLLITFQESYRWRLSAHSQQQHDSETTNNKNPNNESFTKVTLIGGDTSSNVTQQTHAAQAEITDKDAYANATLIDGEPSSNAAQQDISTTSRTTRPFQFQKCRQTTVRNFTILAAKENPPHVAEFMDGSGLLRNNNTHAHESYSVCEIQWKKLALHFAHSMQQLYKCFSWMETRQNINSNTHRILILPRNITQYHDGKTPHNLDTGFVHAMEDVLVTTIVQDLKNSIPTDRDVVHCKKKSPAHVLADPDHGRNFGDKILRHYKRSPMPPKSCEQPPRICILDRKRTRRILNVKQLKQGLETAFPDSPVSIRYFERATFLEQVEVFSSADILISPHGAQLSSIPFLPKCAKPLELFTAGYYVPDFFGSLSTHAGLNHSSAYVGDEATQGDLRYRMKSMKTRVRARAHSMCPNVSDLVQLVQTNIRLWHECCESQ